MQETQWGQGRGCGRDGEAGGHPCQGSKHFSGAHVDQAPEATFVRSQSKEILFSFCSLFIV